MKQLTELKDTKQDAVVKLQENVLALQKRLATWLNWRCRKISPKARLFILIAFCAMSSVFFLLLIAGKT